MPTFILFKNGSVNNTLRGANPTGLRSAIMTASADAAKGPAKSSASFTSKGHVLGSEDNGASGTSLRGGGASSGPWFGGGFADTVGRFFGLYITTLFSLDPVGTAESSPYRALVGHKRN